MLEPTPDMKAFNATTREQLLQEFEMRAATARGLLEKASGRPLTLSSWCVWCCRLVLAAPAARAQQVGIALPPWPPGQLDIHIINDAHETMHVKAVLGPYRSR